MSDRPARLVLDTSAIAAWARGSVSVGELMAKIDLEQGSVIVPLPFLVEAVALLVEGKEWLDLLFQHSAAAVVPDEPDKWRMIADVSNIVGDYASASAAWHALNLGIDVLTRRPERYEELGGGIRLAFDD